MKLKVQDESSHSFDIDYDIFTTDEIIKIINFYNTIIRYNKKKVSKEIVKSQYKEYKNIINSIALEKQYDKKFFDKTGISIYQTMKSLNN